jgi:acyl-CoA thioesterase
MDSRQQAIRIVNAMMDKDLFSQWLDIERVSEGPGNSVLRMLVRPEMVNGFGIVHGGVVFSLADSAFAFASNSRGKHSVSIDTSITHLKPAYPGDILMAEAREVHTSRKLGHYNVRVTNQRDELIAHFKGTVYRKNEEWDV